jgi:hypothetical protein
MNSACKNCKNFSLQYSKQHLVCHLWEGDFATVLEDRINHHQLIGCNWHWFNTGKMDLREIQSSFKSLSTRTQKRTGYNRRNGLQQKEQSFGKRSIRRNEARKKNRRMSKQEMGSRVS